MTPVRRAAVLGSPVDHSLSPVLHRAAYDALGLAWRYDAIECDALGLPALLEQVRAEPGWAGLSLTMPLKTAVMPLLDEVDKVARSVGAVNTVVVGGGTGGLDGTGTSGTGTSGTSGAGIGTGGGSEAIAPVRLSGYNTDIDGIMFAIEQVIPATSVPRHALVLGAGGTARAAVAALCRLGAREIDVVARRPGTAMALVGIGADRGVAVSVLPWHRLDEGLTIGSGPASGPRGLTGGDPLEGVELVVATTPAGATDALAGRPWPPTAALVELLYHPWPTALAVRAAADGAPVVSGLAVLAAQAVGQVELFTGAKVEVGALLAAGEAALATRR